MRFRPRPGLLVLLCLLAGRAPAVEVDAGRQVVLGEQGGISSSLFGVTAFEGFPSVVADVDYRARLAALRPGVVRLAAHYDWYYGDAEVPAGQTMPAAEQAFGQTLLFGNKYAVGRFLPIIRAMGAEPMASLGGVPARLRAAGSDRPADFAAWAGACVSNVALWKKVDPGLRLVQIWNEPNADWWQDPRAKAAGAGPLHIDMARQVAAALKARWPELQVGGPVLCWPPAWPPNQQGQKPWYTWEQWTLPWLAGTKDLIDFFDFHVYDVHPDEFAVQVEMLANQAQLTQGRRLPIWITESNYSVPEPELGDPKAVTAKRVLPYERFLFRGILTQADKIDGNLVHDLRAKHYTLLPRGADDPDPMYWLLWILRDLRGRRLAVWQIDRPGEAVATLEDDRVTVVVFNDDAEPRDLPLSVRLPGGYWTGPEVRAAGPVDGVYQRLTVEPKLERQGGKAVGVVRLPGYATASISFRLSGFIAPARRQVIVERFGDAVLRPLSAPVTVNLPAAPAGSRLRVGMLGAGGPLLTGRWNGKPITLASEALQEVTLPAETLGAANRLELDAVPGAAPNLALAFASLVTSRDE